MNRSVTAGYPADLRFTSEELPGLLATVLKRNVRRAEVRALAGDASTRRYFRVSWTVDGSAAESLIVMQLERPQPEKEPDFLPVQRFLLSLQLPVPRVFHYDAARGLLFLEDCGDLTLEDQLRQMRPEDLSRWYRTAVETLVDMQSRAEGRLGPECPAWHLRFDVDKLMWEMDFMLQHFVRGMRGITLAAGREKELRDALTDLCRTLASEPTVFTHRDYHSRNLMAHGGALIMLDFQDARLGPCQYDLASLLRDSYVELADGFVEEMTEYYLALKKSRDGKTANRDRFFFIFDLMSVQRNLKAVGTFAFQSVIRGNTRYLQYIPRTLGYVARTLSRRPELRPLRQALAPAITELAAT